MLISVLPLVVLSGVTDDTDAINQAISQGNRCGQGCGSSTIAPAVVYFPPGTYLVSSPIVSYYYTQLMGSALNRPTLLAAPSFQGIAVIDEDPYSSDGSNWYINQNNFFRAVYNFEIDLTQMPSSSGTGIHHQVSQATGLFNVHFEMSQETNNGQQGIFMENGSGGFMTDLPSEEASTVRGSAISNSPFATAPSRTVKLLSLRAGIGAGRIMTFVLRTARWVLKCAPLQIRSREVKELPRSLRSTGSSIMSTLPSTSPRRGQARLFSTTSPYRMSVPSSDLAAL